MFAKRHSPVGPTIPSLERAATASCRRGLAPLSALGILIVLLALGGRGPAIAGAQSIGPESALLSVRSSPVSVIEADLGMDEAGGVTVSSPDPGRALLGAGPSITRVDARAASNTAATEVDGRRALLGQRAVTR